MYKILMIIWVPFFVFSVGLKGQNGGSYTLVCEFDGMPDGTDVFLTTQERDTVARAIASDGRFVFKGTLPLEGRFHFINIDSSVSKVVTDAIFLINGNVKVTGRVGRKTVNVYGSTAHNDFIEFGKLMAQIRVRQKINSERLSFYKNAFIRSDSIERIKIAQLMDSLKANQHEIHEEYKIVGIDWMSSHTKSLYTPYALIGFRKLLTINEMQSGYDCLTPEVRDSYYGSKLKDDIEVMRQLSTISEGATIPNFRILTSKGKIVSILDVAAENRLTLIDCWASWCAPCRAEIPNLKKTYESYKERGFNIIGISSDRDTSRWKRAIVEDATPWKHGVEIERGEVTKIFNIDAIPAYILIDGRGKLIAFDCYMSKVRSFGGSLRGDRLDALIEKLLP